LPLEGGRQVQYRVVEVASSSFWGFDKSPPAASSRKYFCVRTSHFRSCPLAIAAILIFVLIVSSTSVQADDELAERYKSYQQYIKSASSAFQKKDYPIAITNYSRAIEMSPFEINNYYNRGIAFFKSGR
jgi:tetratricopeptide (TPR) repeat protein